MWSIYLTLGSPDQKVREIRSKEKMELAVITEFFAHRDDDEKSHFHLTYINFNSI